MQFLRVLRVPHLAVLWSGQVFSALGDQLFLLAIMWTAVGRIGASVGLVTSAGFLAALLFGLVGGVLADRWNRRRTLILVDAARALAVAPLPVLALTSSLHLWHLLLVIVVVETLGALFDPALQASLPLLAGDPQTLYAANGLMTTTYRLARMLGPGMAGLLLLILPLAHFFTLDALSFGASALALLALGQRLDPRPAERTIQVVIPTSRRLSADLHMALRLACGHHPLLWAIGSLGVINLAWSAAFTVGAPLWTSRILHGDAGAYGLIVGAYGAGNVASLLLAGPSAKRPLRAMFLGKVVQGGGFLLLAMATALPLAVLGAVVAAIGGALGDLPLITMIQTEFPPEHIGKIYSLRATVGGAGLMFGLVVATPLFALCGVPLAIALSALLIAGIGLAGLVRFRAR
jgi:MFS family permease